MVLWTFLGSRSSVVGISQCYAPIDIGLYLLVEVVNVKRFRSMHLLLLQIGEGPQSQQ